MTRDEIVAAIRRNADAIKGKGVSKLGIFGSRARDEYLPDSDIDVLVEIEPAVAFSLLNLIDVEQIIEEATGLQAQATVRRSISPHFARQIADDFLEVF
ncbi:nucleotidyltransferase family protein [Bradyrhizobium arachidis]|jgi:predicted nucleotidyltransferase|uniref:nucleotidyltransferase family protein n=1 Tax=Bradyrhizobium arachidis TaxID=858423 RepID=UPI000422D84E|nr:nucleotidyltransferase domain-containing protein [Bradyrhizobium arachidis]QOG20092.1 nucleotidyltransferase domain-containing protein [Bradyrhizobium sp. SEMIA]